MKTGLTKFSVKILALKIVDFDLRRAFSNPLSCSTELLINAQKALFKTQ